MVIIPRKTQALPRVCGIFRFLVGLISDIISDVWEPATEPSLSDKSSPRLCDGSLPENTDILGIEIWVYLSYFKAQGLVVGTPLQHVVGFPLVKLRRFPWEIEI